MTTAAGNPPLLSNYDRSAICKDLAERPSRAMRPGSRSTCPWARAPTSLAPLTDKRLPTLIVQKVIKPTRSLESFQFETTGTGYRAFSLADGQQNVQTLSPGDCTAKDDVVSLGWMVTGNGGTSQVVDTGTRRPGAAAGGSFLLLKTYGDLVSKWSTNPWTCVFHSRTLLCGQPPTTFHSRKGRRGPRQRAPSLAADQFEGSGSRAVCARASRRRGSNRPSRAATATAWVRLLTPIFPMIRWMCVPTVLGLR